MEFERAMKKVFFELKERKKSLMRRWEERKDNTPVSGMKEVGGRCFTNKALII